MTFYVDALVAQIRLCNQIEMCFIKRHTYLFSCETENHNCLILYQIKSTF